MKVTIEKTEKVEVDVQLPYFSTGCGHYYKVEENKTTIVYNKDDYFSIEVKDVVFNYALGFEAISENEFDLQFESVKSKINKI